jgi:hypothetical protein
MCQNGWLDYAYGVWHLVLEDDDHPVWYWSDKDSALAELAGEGWLLNVPSPRRYRGCRVSTALTCQTPPTGTAIVQVHLSGNSRVTKP